MREARLVAIRQERGEYNNVTFTEDLKQLEADMEAAGLDSIVAEVTRQLEAWKAAQ